MAVTCPYCRTAFEADEEIVQCASCGTSHHADCLAENGGCTVFGCAEAPKDEAKVSVSNQDLRFPGTQIPSAQPAAPTSFLNLQTAPVALPPSIPSVTPPPPMPEGAVPAPVPPPPMPWPSSGPAYAANFNPPYSPTFSGHAPAPFQINPGYIPRKSRVVFVLLAVFMGVFGAHNFYAGYNKRGVIQLCITVLTCFFGSIITGIWAIVEACIIDHDNDGITFI